MTNPYAPPRTRVQDAVGAPDSSALGRRKRPELVWVVCVFLAFGLVLSVASLYVLFSGQLRLSRESADFYGQFTPVNFFGIAAGLLLGLASMIQLFRMKRSAPYFLTALLAVTVFKILWYLPHFLQQPAGLLPQALGVVLSVCIVSYAWHLRRGGGLR